MPRVAAIVAPIPAAEPAARVPMAVMKTLGLRCVRRAYTRPLFGCIAVYVQDKIVLVLRDKRTSTEDNGVWLATTREHHESLRREFPTCGPLKYWGRK